MPDVARTFTGTSVAAFYTYQMFGMSFVYAVMMGFCTV